MATSHNSIAPGLQATLNQEQQKAVRGAHGIRLVIAGAGSGKTRVITSRIINLIIHEGVGPENIIALTFTNKAAHEMRERIEIAFGNTQEYLPFIGTFHSYCLRLLKQNASLLAIPTFSIIDEEDQHKILNIIIKTNNLGKRTTAKKLAYQISQIKNSIADPANAGEHSELRNPFMRQIYIAYEHEKKLAHCFDFDDLMLETLALFKKNSNFKHQFQTIVRHVLVDEYQDTNITQHALLKEITLNQKNNFALDSLCVVGDEDQSIYSWRGATITNMINFKQDFPDAQLIKIEQNYRSVEPILNVANHVIEHNETRNPKNLWSTRTAQDRVRIIQCMSEYQEGELITQCVKSAQDKKQKTTIAVLYRAHYQSRAIEEALIKNSLPYKIIGGTQFYERKEIKDMLAYLRLIVNPYDRAALSRIINCPTRGLGEKFEQEFFERWNEEPFIDFKQICNAFIESGDLGRIKQGALNQFLTIFDTIEPTSLPSSALENIITRTSYLQFIKNSYDQQEAESRIENIKELINAVQHLESQSITTINAFLDDVALMQEKIETKQTEHENIVLLMTLHAAKGLEFDLVILTGLEEGLLPTNRALTDTQGVEEERRLFYVGITRAKEYLLISSCRFRYTYGTMNSQLPSRFLDEIPSSLATSHDCTMMRPYEMTKLLATWLGKTTHQEENSSIITFGAARKTIHKGNIQTEESNMPTQHIAWKRHQPVHHEKFGTGIIETIEQREETIYLTIKFKASTKKIDARFVTAK